MIEPYWKHTFPFGYEYLSTLKNLDEWQAAPSRPPCPGVDVRPVANKAPCDRLMALLGFVA